MAIFEPEKFIVDIISHEMNLPPDYGKYQGNIVPSLVIGSQNALLGNTNKLQIIVQSINDRPVANNLYHGDKNDKFNEKIQQVIFSTMQVDIQSRNNEARQRRWELLSTLNSTYCQQMQEKYSCRVFNIPNGFTNTGDVQGGSALNRWTIRFKITYLQEFEKSVEYYNKFPTEVNYTDYKYSFTIE